MPREVTLDANDPLAFEALKRLLSLAAANIGDPRSTEETGRVVTTLVAEVEAGDLASLAWFVRIAGVMTASAAQITVREDPDADPLDALHWFGLGMEQQLRGDDEDEGEID